MLSTRSLFKVLVPPVLWLFVVPVVTLAFLRWAEPKVDGEVFASVARSIRSSRGIPDNERAEFTDFFRAHPASALCRSSEPRLAETRANLCPPWDTSWQLFRASQLAWASLALGLSALLLTLALAGLSFVSAGAQYWTFMLGWRVLPLVGAVQLVMQGVLAVFLTYWVPALLTERFSVKLLLIMGVLAGMTVFTALRALFRKPPERSPLEGELVSEQDAPALWERLRTLAKQVGTEPPAQVVAGIDDNFFVTEAAVRVGEGAKALSGRTLYMSIPLLRLLDSSEASAVFAHELAHFRGGDTAASARLSPLLERYDLYMEALGATKTSAPVYALMNLFRGICTLARSRHQRERELIADRTAAGVTSADDVARSLLKVTAYSNFRAETERSLFSRREQQEAQMGLRQRIESGLGAHVQTPHFAQALQTATTPHPFDSHPVLPLRLQNVGAKVTLDDAASLMGRVSVEPWVAHMPGADGIEQRLWAAYEEQFRAQHNRALAYRYAPATDAEREHVLQYFPKQTFEQKNLVPLTVTYEGLAIPEKDRTVELRFAEIRKATVMNGKVLVVDCLGAAGKRTVKINLARLGAEQAKFRAVFDAYWSRDQSARRYAQSPEPE